MRARVNNAIILVPTSFRGSLGTRLAQQYDIIPYSGYISGGDKSFASSEFWASSWKDFRGRCILNHTPVLCGIVSWVKISWFASEHHENYTPRNIR